MAVVDGIPGIECTVRIRNIPIQMYPDDNEAANAKSPLTKEISRYIEAITNEEFTISLEVSAQCQFDCPVLSFRLLLDGVAVLSSKAYQGKKTSVLFQGALADGGILPFKFRGIETNSSAKTKANIENDARNLAEIGTIRLEVHRATLSDSPPVVNNAISAPPKTAATFVPNLNAPSMVHEKALKGDAKSHGVSLGTFRPIPTRAPKATGAPTRKPAKVVTYLGSRKSPMAVFTFKYRSRESLKQLLIIPRTPSPSPEPEILIEKPDFFHKKEEQSTNPLKNKTTAGKPSLKRENPDIDDAVGIRKKPRKADEIECIDLSED